MRHPILMSAMWLLEYGAHVHFDRGHGCYRPGGIYRWNEWRGDVQSWMRSENLSYYWELIERGCLRDAHQMTKSAFDIYCHQLAGRKYVLHMLVQLPILAQCSVANPELIEIPALTKWTTDLQRIHTQNTKPALTTDHCRRLSLQIWKARQELSEAVESCQRALPSAV